MMSFKGYYSYIIYYETRTKILLSDLFLANNLLSDLFLNILTNAIKYDPKELVHIQIIVKRTIEEDNRIEIQFTDQGKGIPPNIKEVVFDRNKRIERGRIPSIHSTGIGITIIKTLTEIFEGKIQYENRIQNDWTKGTKVVLSFPQIKEIHGSSQQNKHKKIDLSF